MQQDIYLVSEDNFWHSQLMQLNPLTIQIRTGKLQNGVENSIKKQLNQFTTMQQGIEDLSDLIQLKFQQGYKEKQQVKYQPVAKLLDSKVLRKAHLPQQKKPVVYLTDDATMGKLVGEWPRFRARTHLGETLDLGPPGESKPIPCLLAQLWTENINPTNYMLSEKLDGMRVVWSGCEMYTRNGNSINFPASFVEGWPTTYLDGELWLDRGQFQKLVSIARRKQPDYNLWKDIKFMVFDAPFLDEPFANRYMKFKKAIEKIKNKHLVYVPHVVCKGYDHLQEELKLAQQAGGEGLMLRDPESIYEGKRSNTLLKVKTSMDSEATVIELMPGQGKYKNQTGALKVQTDDGVTFSVGVGLNAKMRKEPPKVGTRITYSYYGLTDDGKPRFPVFERVSEEF